MHHLLRRKITFTSLIMFCTMVSVAQIRDKVNKENHDDQPYHFGINLGYNQSHFNFTHHPQFLSPDNTIMDVESINNSGINLSWLTNFRLGQHFDLRVPVGVAFSEKAFLYTEAGIPGSETKKVQSVTITFPVHLAFSSDRIGNMKVYTIAGGKFDYDMASNAKAKKAEELIKLNRTDLSAELGLGFHFYFPFFVLSPEIKLSSGLINLHSRDAGLKYSNVIDKVNSRMVTFSLTVE